MAALGEYSCLCEKAKNTLKWICKMKKIEVKGCVDNRTINRENKSYHKWG
jgi:hypothetical protein